MMKEVSATQKKLGFNIHALAVLVALPVLLVVNLWTGTPYWIVWVLLGAGIGLLSHWFFVLGPGAGASKAGTT